MTWPATIVAVDMTELGQWTAPSLPQAGDTFSLGDTNYMVRGRYWLLEKQRVVIAVESMTPTKTQVVK